MAFFDGLNLSIGIQSFECIRGLAIVMKVLSSRLVGLLIILASLTLRNNLTFGRRSSTKYLKGVKTRYSAGGPLDQSSTRSIKRKTWSRRMKSSRSSPATRKCHCRSPFHFKGVERSHEIRCAPDRHRSCWFTLLEISVRGKSRLSVMENPLSLATISMQ